MQLCIIHPMRSLWFKLIAYPIVRAAYLPSTAASLNIQCSEQIHLWFVDAALVSLRRARLRSMPALLPQSPTLFAIAESQRDRRPHPEASFVNNRLRSPAGAVDILLRANSGQSPLHPHCFIGSRLPSAMVVDAC